jgi:hypothetical protein
VQYGDEKSVSEMRTKQKSVDATGAANCCVFELQHSKLQEKYSDQ